MAQLEEKLGRPPTMRKAAESHRDHCCRLFLLLQEVAATTLLSLDEPWSEGGQDGEKLRLTDMVADTSHEDPAVLVTGCPEVLARLSRLCRKENAW